MQIDNLLNPEISVERRLNAPSYIHTDASTLSYESNCNPYYDARIAPLALTPLSNAQNLTHSTGRFIFPSPIQTRDQNYSHFTPETSLMNQASFYRGRAKSGNGIAQIVPSQQPFLQSYVRSQNKRKASTYQIALLERIYLKNKFPTAEQVTIIGDKAGMKGYSVKFWFQNKRQGEASRMRGLNIEVPKWNGQRYELDFGDESLIDAIF